MQLEKLTTEVTEVRRGDPEPQVGRARRITLELAPGPCFLSSFGFTRPLVPLGAKRRLALRHAQNHPQI